MLEETTIIRSKAIFSDDKEYRLFLRKEWNSEKPSAMVIMINPNTADTVIEQYAAMSDAIIIAWGTIGKNTLRVRKRQKYLLEMIKQHANKMYQIGRNACHLLTPAVRREWTLEPYEMEEIK